MDLDHYARLAAAEERASQVRGRHYIDWIPQLNEWRKARRDDESLQLLMEIIDAAERAAAVHGREPAPAYTDRAAIILRRRGDYAGEVAVLERYQRACPPGRGSEGMVKRLEKARELLAEAR